MVVPGAEHRHRRPVTGGEVHPDPRRVLPHLHRPARIRGRRDQRRRVGAEVEDDPAAVRRVALDRAGGLGRARWRRAARRGAGRLPGRGRGRLRSGTRAAARRRCRRRLRAPRRGRQRGSAPLRPSRALAEIGTARGGSYAVPAITVCTPHHDSVTAAPVASDHASACTSPRCIRPSCTTRVPCCPRTHTDRTAGRSMAYGAAHGKCARGRGRPVRTLRPHPAPDRGLPHGTECRHGAGGAARGRPLPLRRGHPRSRSARPRRVRGAEDAARHHRRTRDHRDRAGRRDARSSGC